MSAFLFVVPANAGTHGIDRFTAGRSAFSKAHPRPCVPAFAGTTGIEP
jgi:hypothetical protein